MSTLWKENSKLDKVYADAAMAAEIHNELVNTTQDINKLPTQALRTFDAKYATFGTAIAASECVGRLDNNYYAIKSEYDEMKICKEARHEPTSDTRLAMAKSMQCLLEYESIRLYKLMNFMSYNMQRQLDPW